MLESYLTYSVALLLPIASAVVLYPYVRSSRSKKYPPGPVLYPLVGNLLSFPLKSPWSGFVEDAKDDIIYYRGLGNSILVLNSMESMNDLLVNKGNLCLSRPSLVVANELMDLGKSMALIPFGRRWRLHRKLSRIALSSEKTTGYESTLSAASHALTECLLQNPEDFVDHVRLATGQGLMSTLYGIDVNSANDPFICKPKEAMEVVRNALVVGAFFIDLIPALKYLPEWLPFASFHKDGIRGRNLVRESMERPFQRVKQDIAAGTARESFTMDVMTKDEFAAEREKDEEFETTVKWASVTMLAAGQEVVTTAMLNMILAMATHPDKLKRAQAELKNVLGPRSPSVKDRDDLPYVHAIIKETLRWQPPLKMVLARSSIEDDSYRGYFIPKDTVIVPNIWAIAYERHGEYPPEEFAPERFLVADPPTDPYLYTFGFGKRICPGKLLAENAMFLMTANILKTFDIVPSIDEDGNEIPIRIEHYPGILSDPLPFRCTFKPCDP